MNIISAEKWMHDLYTVDNAKTCNEFKQLNRLLTKTSYI